WLHRLLPFHRYARGTVRCILLLLLALSALVAAGEGRARVAEARIERIDSAVAVLHEVRVRLEWPADAGHGALRITAARARAPDLGYEFADLAWACPLSRPAGEGEAWSCNGELDRGEGRARVAEARIERIDSAVAVLHEVRVRLEWPADAGHGALRITAARARAPDLGYEFADLAWACPLSRPAGEGEAWSCNGE